MNTVQSVPLCVSISVAPFFALPPLPLCSPIRPARAPETRNGRRGAWQQSGKASNNPLRRRALSLRQKRSNKQTGSRTLCYSWVGGGRASLLTCTIKASFAKRKCSSLFSGGQKVERVFSMGAASFTRVGLVIGCATTRGTFVTRTDTVTLENAGDKPDNFAWWLDKEGHTF